MVAAHRRPRDEQAGAPAPSDHIVRIDGVMGGRPVIRGTRVTVASVRGRISGGDSIDDLMLDYPGVPREAFEAALTSASSRAWPDR